VSSSNAFRERFFRGTPRYQWRSTLGRGGMGIVFLAKDLDLDDDVAIKVLQPTFDGNEKELLSRFKREIQLNRKIKHPNVARIHDFGMSGEYPYITMEYIAGKDLKTIIAERKRIPEGDAVTVLRQLARGTQAAHELGIIHRDLKPQNIMLEEGGAVAILDFGLARGRTNQGLTADSIVLGTPHYIAPEQAMGGEADARSDLYSIGIIAYEMLTGGLPFVGDTPIATALKQVTEPVPPTLAALPDVSTGLKTIVLRLLEKNPIDRFASASDLDSELAAVGEVPESPAGASPAGPRPSAPAPAAPAREAPPRPAGPIDTSTPLMALRINRPKPAVPPPARPVRAPESEPGVALSPHAAVPTVIRQRPPFVLIVGPESGASKALEAVGCRTGRVPDGNEALETLMKNPPDLVLMDVALPGMDGFDVTRIIKSRPEFSKLPVLLMSTRSDRKLFAFAIQAGAADFVRKPLAPAFLSWRVWQLLARLGYTPPADVRSAPAS
jgi:serine/threonine protein kinase/CheY-like chemotaxis protein